MTEDELAALPRVTTARPGHGKEKWRERGRVEKKESAHTVSPLRLSLPRALTQLMLGTTRLVRAMAGSVRGVGTAATGGPPSLGRLTPSTSTLLVCDVHTIGVIYLQRAGFAHGFVVSERLVDAVVVCVGHGIELKL